MEMEANDAHTAHAAHARMGFIIVSGKMSAANTKDGEWKKSFAFPRGWQNKTALEYDKRATGFALVTGAKSDCTLVARTKKGFHYVYKYDARILPDRKRQARHAQRRRVA